MLALIWRHAPLAHQREAVTRALALELLKRNEGEQMIAGLLAGIDQLFRVDVLGGEGCKQTVQAIMARKSVDGLILPASEKLAG